MARGDHIFVSRLGGVYGHHGIDCGDGTVIHYTSSHWYSLRQVRRTGIHDFARGDDIETKDYSLFFAELVKRESGLPGGGSKRFSVQPEVLFQQFKHLSVKKTDFGVDAVIRRAESRLGEYAFDLFFNNCEHFASWCKTGISESEQVNALWKQALSPSDFSRLSRAETLTDLAEWPEKAIEKGMRWFR